MPEPAPEPVLQQTLVIGAGEASRTQLPLQTGVTQRPQPDGKVNGAAPPTSGPNAAKEKDDDNKTKAPPVPRPRLLQIPSRP